jgi:subtilisin
MKKSDELSLNAKFYKLKKQVIEEGKTKMKNKIRITTILMTLILLISFSATIASANANNPNIEVIIGFTNENQAKQAVTNSRGTVTQTFTIIPALVATIPQNAITALQKNPNIQYVELNHEVYALQQQVPWGIDRVFGERRVLGFPQRGVFKRGRIKVAVLDTGIDTGHDDLTTLLKAVRF